MIRIDILVLTLHSFTPVAVVANLVGDGLRYYVTRALDAMPTTSQQLRSIWSPGAPRRPAKPSGKPKKAKTK